MNHMTSNTKTHETQPSVTPARVATARNPMAEMFALYGRLTLDQRIFVLQKAGAKSPQIDIAVMSQNKLLLTVAAIAEANALGQLRPSGAADVFVWCQFVAELANGMTTNAVGLPVSVTAADVIAVEMLLSLVPDGIDCSDNFASCSN